MITIAILPVVTDQVFTPRDPAGRLRVESARPAVVAVRYRMCSAKDASGGGDRRVGLFFELRHGAAVGSRCSAARIVRPGLAGYTVVTAASRTKPLSTNSVSGST